MEENHRIPFKWIFWLSAPVIVAAILTAIIAMFAFPSPTLFQYRITIALVCFALSSIAGLLFVSRVELTGTVGVFAITLGGTAALWLVALLIFGSVFPEGLLPTQRLIKKVPITGEIVRDGLLSHAGILVAVFPQGYSAFTDSNGKYTIEVLDEKTVYTGLAYYTKEGKIGDVFVSGIDPAKMTFNYTFRRE